MLRSTFLSAGLVLGCLACGVARADYPYGWLFSAYPRVYAIDSVPYFAAHPPLCYTRPIAWPYAFLPEIPSPTMLQGENPSAVQPLVIRNAYYHGEFHPNEYRRATPEPLVIVNPFVRK